MPRVVRSDVDSRKVQFFGIFRVQCGFDACLAATTFPCVLNTIAWIQCLGNTPCPKFVVDLPRSWWGPPWKRTHKCTLQASEICIAAQMYIILSKQMFSGYLFVGASPNIRIRHWRRECWRHLWSGPVRALGGSQRVWEDVAAAAQCMQCDASNRHLHFFFLSCT